jgi:hypothetical protein
LDRLGVAVLYTTETTEGEEGKIHLEKGVRVDVAVFEVYRFAAVDNSRPKVTEVERLTLAQRRRRALKFNLQRWRCAQSYSALRYVGGGATVD